MPVVQTGIYPHMLIAITGPFVTLTFSLSNSSKVKSDGTNQKPMVPAYKCSGIQPRICHRFRDILSQRF